MAISLSELLAGKRIDLPPEAIPTHDNNFLQWVRKQADRRTITREKFEKAPIEAIAALKNAKVNALKVLLQEDGQKSIHYGDRVAGQIQMLGDSEFWRSETGDHSTGTLVAAIYETARDFRNYLEELRWQRKGFVSEKKYSFDLERNSTAILHRTGLFILDNEERVTIFGATTYKHVGAVDFIHAPRDFSIRQLPSYEVITAEAREQGFKDMLQYAQRFGKLTHQDPISAVITL